MSDSFTVIQKIKMGFGGLFLSLIPVAVLTAVLFTFFADPMIWILTAALLGFGFYCGVLMLTPSKLPRNYFLTISVLAVLVTAAVWIF